MLFAIVGSAGNAILFICSLVALTMLAVYTFAFASHCYLVVVQGTAAGLDRVDWPDEPVVDWVFQGVYLGGLLLLWLMPAGILSRALSSDLLPGQGALRFLLIAGPVMWLFFPIGLLSSLASSSRWIPLSPRVLFRLLRLFPWMFLFYLITGVLLAVVFALAYFGVFTAAWYAMPVAAIGGSAGLLIHARLLGRIAWLMGQRSHKPASARKKAAGPPPRKKSTRPPRALASHDPWTSPEEEESGEEESPPAPGYCVVEQVVEDRPARPSYLDPEPEPYIVADAGPEEAPPAPPGESIHLNPAQVERELELRRRAPPNPPPALPLFSGVFTFPAYESSRKAWLWLVVWGAATGAVLRMTLMFWPF